jgi:hypothetical protein
LHQQWGIPEVNGAFVTAMEDVLEVYAEPSDLKRPQVTFNETSKQLIGETRQPLPAQPGHAARYDDEYNRNGTRQVFLFCEPQAGGRHVAVMKRRAMQDFTRRMQWLVDERYPAAEVIRVRERWGKKCFREFEQQQIRVVL